MQLVKRVIQQAREHALGQFSALARTMVNEADAAMSQDLADVHVQLDRRALTAALQALRQEQAKIVHGFDSRYRDGVERAMRTMYTDLREGLDRLSANTLSLIDDETVNRQLEVGHLVQRLRDACDENLGRLNIIIAQLHGDAEVHERENPFRPYLIARALYDSLKERVADEEISKILFARLSDSLAAHLANYYASICDVFDANGIQARLLARPTKLKRHQRDQLAQQLAAMNSTANGAGFPAFGGLSMPGGAAAGGDSAMPLSSAAFNSRILPAMQRMLTALRGDLPSQISSEPAAAVGASPLLSEEFQELVWKLFNQTSPALQTTLQMAGETGVGSEQAAAGVLSPMPADVLRQVDRFQQQAAERDDGVEQEGEASPTPQNLLFELSEQLELPQQSSGQRMAIDVVAVLFEFLLEDEQIPASVRARIARLQIPFLKAAMLEPQLLQKADHPARQLLNRISSAAIGLDPQTPMAQRLDAEIGRLVKRVLNGFDQDTALFTECLQEFEHFLATELATADAETAGSIQAVEDAEQFTAVLSKTTESLRGILASVYVDQRVKEFIEKIWARVLVKAAMQDATSGASALSQQCRDVLPDLVWSAQEKTSPDDRSALIRMLPGLVKRLRSGMLMVQMPEEECKAALDMLVPVHTQVLRPQAATESTGKWPSLEDLRKEFARLVTSEEKDAWILAEPVQVEPEVLETALADRGIDAEVELARPSIYAATPAKDLLSQLQVGSCVEFRAGDTAAPARVIWVSRHYTLFIFRLDGQTKPMVYSATSLLQALQSGKIGLLEYAPAFDRAVDALMMGAEALQSAHPGTASGQVPV